MLEGLEDIEWQNLDHAYGSAEDTPEKLRALLSSDPEERSWAQDMLEMSILHQGSVCSATAYSIPFLQNMLRNQDAPDRPWIVQFLANIARGADLRIVYLNLNREEVIRNNTIWFKLEREETEKQIEQELEWLRLASKNVSSGLADYLQLLKEKDPDIRRPAIGILLSLSNQKKQVIPVIKEQMTREDDDKTICLCILGLASFGEGEDLLVQACNDEQRSNLVKMAACFSLVILQGPRVSEDTLAQLDTLLKTDVRSLGTLHWMHQQYLASSQVEWFTNHLHVLGMERGSRLVPTLLDIYVNEQGYKFLKKTLFHLAFPGSLPPNTIVTDLSVIQRRVFQAYLDDDYLWTSNIHDFHDFGIQVSSREQFAQFMHGERSAVA